MTYSRFAIYDVPRNGPLADFGASWLGRAIAKGRKPRQPHVPGLDEITMTQRNHGFHGTLKPPFRLVDTHSFKEMDKAASEPAASPSRRFAIVRD